MMSEHSVLVTNSRSGERWPSMFMVRNVDCVMFPDWLTVPSTLETRMGWGRHFVGMRYHRVSR